MRISGTEIEVGRNGLRRLAQSGREAQNLRSLTAARTGAILQIPEQRDRDHRRLKQRIRPMLGFKRFETAAVTIRGIELAEKIKKHQFSFRPLTGKAIIAPEMWAVVLAA